MRVQIFCSFFFVYSIFLFSKISAQIQFQDPDCLHRCEAGLQEDPCLMSVIGSQSFIEAGGFTDQITITGDHFGISANAAGFRVGLVDPLNPILLGFFTEPGVTDISRAGEYFLNNTFMATVDNNGLYIVNISNTNETMPFPYVSSGFISLPNPSRLMITDNPPRVYVTDSSGVEGIVAIDITDLTNPILNGSIITTISGRDLSLSPDRSWFSFCTGEFTPGYVSIVRIPEFIEIENRLPLPDATSDVDTNNDGTRLVVVGGFVALINSTDITDLKILDVIFLDTNAAEADFAMSDPSTGIQDRVLIISDNNFISYDISQDRFIEIGRWDASVSIPEGIDRNLFTLIQFELFDDLQFMLTTGGSTGAWIFCPGTLLSRPPPDENNDLGRGTIAGIVVGSCCFCFCSIVIVSTIIFRRRISKSRDLIRDLVPLHETKNSTMNEMTFLKDIDIEKVIGKGAFGQVYKGNWNSIPVALKTLNVDDVTSFEKEVKILAELNHKHIIRLYGLFKDKDITYIVTEFMDKGDLKTLLHKDLSISVTQLETIAYHVAVGMEYLHGRTVIHRDLAARNLLVSLEMDNYLVKVADFGLSHQSEYSYTTQKKFPLRWSPPEAISTRVFKKSSDIWSYGIVLWEIFSRGGFPYNLINSDEDVYKKLVSGYRMEAPDEMPKYFEKIMKKCWKKSPKERPSFKSIRKVLSPHLNTIENQSSKGESTSKFESFSQKETSASPSEKESTNVYEFSPSSLTTSNPSKSPYVHAIDVENNIE